jgi:hypothetical protein
VCSAGSRYIGGISIHRYTVYYIKCFLSALDEYFPYSVRERFISDLIISYFQNNGQPLLAYI